MHFLTVVQNKGVLFQLKMNQVERKEKLLLFVEKCKSENPVRTSFVFCFDKENISFLQYLYSPRSPNVCVSINYTCCNCTKARKYPSTKYEYMVNMDYMVYIDYMVYMVYMVYMTYMVNMVYMVYIDYMVYMDYMTYMTCMVYMVYIVHMTYMVYKIYFKVKSQPPSLQDLLELQGNDMVECGEYFLPMKQDPAQQII